MKIALLGSAPSSVQLAPTQDQKYANYLGGKSIPSFPPSDVINEDWQIWGCSPGAWSVLPRSDRWFELHRWEPGKPWFSPEYVQFLRTYRGIVYTGGEIPEIPNHVVYPLDQVEEQFSAYFLSSSLALMCALAIMEIEADRAKTAPGVATKQEFDAWCQDRDDVIGMWGVDMSATEEYGAQRDGCMFFLLEALRRGISIYTPPESCLLRPKPVYGISEWNHDYIKMTARMRELNARKNAAEQQATAANQEAIFLRGAVDDLTYHINTWTNPYGLPAGVRMTLTPGTGLGGGITYPRPEMSTPHAEQLAANAMAGQPAAEQTLAPSPLVQSLVNAPWPDSASSVSQPSTSAASVSKAKRRRK